MDAMDWRYIIQEWRGLKLPHFIVIGAQKSGTTSLHEWLLHHPDVFLAAIKETHYFTTYFDQPVRWYANHYAQARAGQLRGDITPYYAFHPYVPERIATLLPTVRLVYLVRDPVKRAISHYFHAFRLGKELLSIDHALAAETERLAGSYDRLRAPGSHDAMHQSNSYVARSRYENQILHYRRFFPNKQLLVLRSEDLFANDPQTWQRLLQHIGAPMIPLDRLLPQANAGRGESMNVAQSTRDALRDNLDPTYRWMASEYGIRWD
jgi:hypothetical protein